jgi:hypothetical protein
MATLTNHVRQVHAEKLTIVVVDIVLRHHCLDDLFGCTCTLTFGTPGLKVLLTGLSNSFVVKRSLPNHYRLLPCTEKGLC